MWLSSVSAQFRLRGVVSDKDGKPLGGATVVIRGVDPATLTATDGSFEIKTKIGDILFISFVGYRTQQVTVQNNSIIRVVLQLSPSLLEDVLVTGYTSQKVKEITGSVATVTPRDLVSIPAGQVEQMLQGKVAGLTVISSGEPGASANIRLHGIGNFGNVTPLYIIDGIEGDINSINPYDIESLQVLKDAASYSIYGVRGANGVIVVTTRKGRSATPKINYDFYVGLMEPLSKQPDHLNPQEEANALWKASKNSNQPPGFPLFGYGQVPILPDYLFAGPHQDTLYEGSPYVAEGLYNLDANKGAIYQIVRFNKSGTDWYHELFKPAWSQQHTISVSSATEKTNYFFSLGYLDQQGTFLNTYLKRFTLRLNTEVNLFNTIHVGENLQASYTDNPKAGKYNPSVSGPEIFGTLLADPSWPVYDIKGAWNPGYGVRKGPLDNLVAIRVNAKDNKNKTWRVLGNVFAEINFLEYFKFRSSFGGNLTYFYNYNFAPASYDYPLNGYPNSLTETSGYVSSTTFTNSVSFSKSYGNGHKLNAFVASEMISNQNREEGASSYDLAFSNPNYWILGNGTLIPGAANSNFSLASTTRLNSFIGRVEYGYKEKYLFTGNLRRDGSSIFGPENRYGWFPSVGVAWRITEEEFIGKSNWLSDLKLRASWGKTGYSGNTDPSNQFTLYGGSPADAYYDIMGVSSGSIQRGFRVITAGNAHTGWQQDVVTNIGIESILFNGKLSITADWYRKFSNGLLFPIALPDLLGSVIPPNVNVGKIENTGVDLLISSRGSFSKDLGWNFSLTFTQYTNKIQKLNNIPYFFDGFGWVKNEVGHPVSSFYGYKILGYFNSDDDVTKFPLQDAAAPGRFKYMNTNGDGIIDDKDRTYIGNPNPWFTTGVNIGLNYRNFDFSAFFYGSFGNDVLNFYDYAAKIYNGPGVHDKVTLYDSWTPDHHNAKSPIAELSNNFSNNAANNSFGIEKGSYFRNKSMILGYNFPKYSLGRIKMDHFRIYFQITNLFTITSYSGADPELPDAGLSPLAPQAHRSTFGIDIGNYPNSQKQFLFGINIGLQ